MRIDLRTSFALVFLALVIVSGIAPTQSQPVATPNAVGTVAITAQMDPVPTDCGILAEPIKLDSQDGAVIGGWPLLLGLPNDSTQHRGILSFPTEHTQTDGRLPGWWATKMAWFVSESYQGTVKVQAFNVKDGSPIYINWKGDDLTTTAELDPKKSFSFVQGMAGWAFFPSIVWVSKAGCYRFEAEWNGGAWRQIVAVGHTSTP